MNDLDFCLEVVYVMSTITSHSPLNISDTVRDRGLVPKDTNRKWRMGNRMITWPMTSHYLERSTSWPQYA